MKKLMWTASILALVVTAIVALGMAQQPQNRIDVLNMVRPIEMHDTVWMADLTSVEARDLIKAGKTTALVMTGGVEENGPYLVLDKHNIVSRVMGEAIARKLGNALVAPVIPIEPGNPEKGVTPGAPVFTDETFKTMLMDIATSLRTMGFKNVVFLGDSAENLKPMQDAANTLNSKWKGEGARILFVEKYGNSGPDSGCCGHGTVIKYQEDVLGVHETNDGFHANYHMSSMIMTRDLNGVRLPERIKAKKTTTNGVDLVPAAKTIENGRKIIEFRTDVTVKEIQRQMAMSKTNQ
jgi:creatinine amidohydrolase